MKTRLFLTVAIAFMLVTSLLLLKNNAPPAEVSADAITNYAGRLTVDAGTAHTADWNGTAWSQEAYGAFNIQVTQDVTDAADSVVYTLQRSIDPVGCAYVTNWADAYDTVLVANPAVAASRYISYVENTPVQFAQRIASVWSTPVQMAREVTTMSITPLELAQYITDVESLPVIPSQYISYTDSTPIVSSQYLSSTESEPVQLAKFITYTSAATDTNPITTTYYYSDSVTPFAVTYDYGTNTGTFTNTYNYGTNTDPFTATYHYADTTTPFTATFLYVERTETFTQTYTYNTSNVTPYTQTYSYVDVAAAAASVTRVNSPQTFSVTGDASLNLEFASGGAWCYRLAANSTANRTVTTTIYVAPTDIYE